MGHMKQITSSENRIVKQIKKLKTKKGREQQGCYMIEGPNLIREAVASHAQILFVLFCDDVDAWTDELRDLCNEAEKLTDVYGVPRQLFQSIGDTVTSQNVLAVVSMKKYDRDFLARKDVGRLVVLDRLQDPGNVGTIIRTADAAGFDAVVTLKGTVDIFSPKTVRSAAGAIFRIPVVHEENIEDLIELLHHKGMKIVAADAAGERPYYDEIQEGPIAIIIGNEGNGLRNEFLRSPFITTINIPMREGAESLNASVAAAILMYETVRKTKRNGVV